MNLRKTGLAATLMLVLFSPMATSKAFACDMNCAGNQNFISTQGHGEVKVRPDSLTLPLSIQSRKETLTEARTENNRKAQSVITAIKALNIPNLKLETRNISVSPVQDSQRGKLPKVIGYQVFNSLQVSVVNATPDKLGEYGSRIMDTALNAGANQTGGLDFFVADMSSVRAQALELAVKDARRNAEAMSRAAGITLTGVLSLEGTPQFGGYPRMMSAAPMMKAAGADQVMESVPVETGETTITSDVSARFKF